LAGVPFSPPPADKPVDLPPPEPSPVLALDFPPGSLADAFISPLRCTVILVACHDNDHCGGNLSLPPLDSVIHMVGTPRVCGIDGSDTTSVTVNPTGDTCPLVDGGSNICVTGDLHLLVDTVDISPVTISVALDGVTSSVDDSITKRGLLPLTLSDGTIYYQPCYYCANLVETIISPAAVLASSDRFYYWTKIGCKDPTTPGTLQFISRDGGLSMTFDLYYHEGLYYCTLDVFTVGIINLAATTPLRQPLLMFVAPLLSSPLLPRPVRSNLKSGCSALVHLGNVNWTSSHNMSSGHPQYLSIIRFGMLFLKSRPTYKNRPLNGPQSVFRRAVLSFTWILPS
jgi:hypothetical protein